MPRRAPAQLAGASRDKAAPSPQPSAAGSLHQPLGAQAASKGNQGSDKAHRIWQRVRVWGTRLGAVSMLPKSSLCALPDAWPNLESWRASRRW